MAEEILLGVDLSTHGAKVLAVNRRGDLCARGSKSYLRSMGAGGEQEQPLAEVTEALFQSIRQVVGDLQPDQRIVGMAITHQRGTLIGLDGEREPIGPAVCDSDTRSWEQANWLEQNVGSERLFNETGCPPLPFNGLTKILWWLRGGRGQSDRVRYWLSMQDWAVFKLTNELKSSPGSALRLGVLDITQSDQYALALLEELGIPSECLLSLHPYGEILGTVCLEASKESGLPTGIPVFPAPGDQPAAMIGAGALDSRTALISLGTSFLISLPILDLFRAVPNLTCTMEILPEGRFALEYGEGCGTNVLDWLRDLLKLDEVEDLNTLAATSPPGARGVRVRPHWWAIRDPNQYGSIQGLRSYHNRADIIRSTLEGLVFELAGSFNKLTTAAGLYPQRVALCGGGSRSAQLCQMIADILDVPVYCGVNPEASALGAALTAAHGIGWTTTVAEASKAMIRSLDFIHPNEVNRDFYRKQYQDYE